MPEIQSTNPNSNLSTTTTQALSPSPIEINKTVRQNKSYLKLVFAGFLLVAIVLVGFFFFLLIKNKTNSNTLQAKTTYTGQWQVPEVPTFRAQLTIISIQGNKAIIKYEWGDKMGTYSQGYSVVDADVNSDGKNISWNRGQAKYSFTLKGNKFMGTRDESGSISSITMEPKVDLILYLTPPYN